MELEIGQKFQYIFLIKIQDKLLTGIKCYIHQKKENDDQHLIELVNKHGKNWILFSEMFNRPYHTILSRYNYITNPRKPWTFEENIKLNEAIINYGENWFEILKLFPYRKLNHIIVQIQN